MEEKTQRPAPGVTAKVARRARRAQRAAGVMTDWFMSTPDVDFDFLHICDPEARADLEAGLEWALPGRWEWLPEYDNVARWLTDNCGRGLLLYGGCGRGKSILTRGILPRIMAFRYRFPDGSKLSPITCVTAQEMNARLDDLLWRRVVAVDDVGTEGQRVDYGNRRWAFCELVDAAEAQRHTLILSTNLTPAQLGERYGERTLDRLRQITATVPCIGRSLRGAKKEEGGEA